MFIEVNANKIKLINIINIIEIFSIENMDEKYKKKKGAKTRIVLKGEDNYTDVTEDYEEIEELLTKQITTNSGSFF